MISFATIAFYCDYFGDTTTTTTATTSTVLYECLNVSVVVRGLAVHQFFLNDWLFSVSSPSGDGKLPAYVTLEKTLNTEANDPSTVQ